MEDNHGYPDPSSNHDCSGNHDACACCCKDGKDGKDGRDGRDGINGANGKDGRDGVDGANGRDGRDGINGVDGVDGVNGCCGPQGHKGHTGCKGPTGDMGPTGPTGDVGPTGPTGDMGPTGPTGDVGPTGPRGPFEPAYLFAYSDTQQILPLGERIDFHQLSLIFNFTRINDHTYRCDVSGVYSLSTTVDTLEPNSCAVYINGNLYPGGWFGANATAQDIGTSLAILNAGDLIDVRNQSSQGGTITLFPLGSGANPNVGQSTAALTVFRIA